MVSAVLFAKDLRKVATFYTRVCSAKVKKEDAHHADLDCGGFQLNFPIADVVASRAVAQSLGGEIDDRPPPWAGDDARFHLGHDPEGNVFGAEG
jgi:hypothetical protein